MRVALLAYRGTMKSGGLGGYLHPLSRELARRGHEVDLYVGPPYPDPMPWLAREVRLHDEHHWGRKFTASWRAPLPRRGSSLGALEPLALFELAVTRFGFFPEPFAFSVRAARELVRALRAGRPYDVVHDVQTLGYGDLLLLELGLPVVATVHHPLTIDLRSSLARDRSFSERKGSLTFHPVRTQGRVARRIDAILTASADAVREIEAGFRVPRARIHNVGNGVELPAPGAARAPRGRPELLFLGRCADPNKGFEVLMQALAELPDHVTLRVLDDAPDPRTPLARALLTLGLAPRLSFEGKRPRAELERALACADAVVVPSLYEGFGLPAIEALAAGTPLVASSAGALPEVVARAGAGVLVPPNDPSALAKAILRVLESWRMHQRAAVDARPRLEAGFGWGPVAERTLQVYDMARAARRGRPATMIRSASG
jgi:glycosyltransferase involved in cell wall biosynthesis